MAETQADFEMEENTPEKAKSSSNKGILVILTIIVLAIFVLTLLIFLRIIKIPQNQFTSGIEFLSEYTDDGSIETIDNIVILPTEPQSIEIQPVEPPPIKIEDKAVPPPAQPLRYIFVGKCVYDDCVKELKRELSVYKLDSSTKAIKNKTTYFEVISQTSYTKERAEDKIKLINQHNGLFGFPTLSRYAENQYRITFGQFPLRETANHMKTHLNQLYPQIKLDFEIVPKAGEYLVKHIYAGPITQKKAEKVLPKLQNNPLFDTPKIVQHL